MEVINGFGSLFGIQNNGYLLMKTKSSDPYIIHKVQNYQMKYEKELLQLINSLKINIKQEKYQYNDFNMHSKYINTYYEAVFFLIHDSNDISQQKMIILLVTNESTPLNDIENLQYISKLIFSQNINQFSKEIITKIHVMNSQIKKEGIETLIQVAKDLNLNPDDENLLIDERFLLSTNRNPELLFNKDESFLLFTEYVMLAPFHDYLNKSQTFNIGIGNSSKLNLFTYAASIDPRSLYVKLAHSTILANLIFSCLISRPLIIVSNNTERFLLMGIKLSCFVPNFEISKLILSESIDPQEITEGMICVTKSLKNNNIEHCSVLRIDQNLYEGVIVERDSEIIRISRMEPAQSSPAFLYTAYNKIFQYLNKIEITFTKAIKMSKTEFNISRSLIQAGIKRCDFPIVFNLLKNSFHEEEAELIIKHMPTIQKAACFF